MKLFDAHVHLAHPAFDADRAAVLADARGAGVTRMHVPGYDPASWSRACALEATGALRGVGLHPWWVHGADPVEIARGLDALGARLAEGGVVSVGEIGLDRAQDRARSFEAQRRALDAQLALARRHDLPVALHVVDAHGAMLEHLAAHATSRGYVHGFAAAPEVAARYVALGLHVSFGGSILRPNAERARASARVVPIDRLLVETDAPDGPRRGTRGAPSMLDEVVKALAAVRDVGEDDIAEATYANASRLFGA